MAILATDSGGGSDFKPVATGTHFAVCDMVVDLGNQKITSAMYGDSIKHQVYVRWQIPAERIEYEKDGEQKNLPAVIGKFYTVSLGEKANLRKDLEAWRGRKFTADELKGFDVANLLGKGATISVTHRLGHDGKVYANVTSVGGIPKGTQAPQLEGETVLYDEDHQEAYERLSKGLKAKIDGQVRDYPDPHSQPPASREPAFADDLNDDVPF